MKSGAEFLPPPGDKPPGIVHLEWHAGMGDSVMLVIQNNCEVLQNSVNLPLVFRYSSEL